MRGSRPVYEFRHFRLDENEQVLLCAGKPVPLTLKAFAVLVFLVENAGHLVLKDELLRRAWPDAIVGEGNLAQAVSALRKALGESHKSHRNHEYIETVARRGYRFIALVRRDNPVPSRDTETKVRSSEYQVESDNAVEGSTQNPIIDYLAKGYSENGPAHALYRRGRYYRNKYIVDGLNQSVDYFWRDLKINPDHALTHPAESYDGLSDVYLPPGNALSKAIAVVTNPVQTDEALAQAHTLLGLIRTFYDHDWPLAENDFKRAIELAPGSALPYKRYGLALGMLGRFDEAIARLSRALASEPRSPEMHVGLGIVLYLARRFDAAIAQAQIALDLKPKFYPAQVLLGIAYLQQSRLAEAVTELQKLSLPANVAVTAGYAGDTYDDSGERRQALKILTGLEKRAERSYVSPYALALIHAGLDHREEALRLLHRTCEDQTALMGFINLAAEFDGLRSDQTFSALLTENKF